MYQFATALQILFLLVALIALIPAPLWRHPPCKLYSLHGNDETCGSQMTAGRTMRSASRPVRRLWRGRSTFC